MSKSKSKSHNDYEKIAVLGHGESTEVWHVKDLETNQSLAIKIIPKNKISYNEVKKEVAILEKIQPYCQTYLLCYHQIFDDDLNTYIVTEYLDNYVLLSTLKDLNTQNIIIIAHHLIKGLDEIHLHNIAHRDIKPTNILVNPSNYDIKYIDFGFSCMDADCQKSSWKGSPLYMAPELYFGQDKKFTVEQLQNTDWWALGNVIYELVNGETPYLFWFEDHPNGKFADYLKLYKFLILKGKLGKTDHKFLWFSKLFEIKTKLIITNMLNIDNHRHP